jgi:protein-S-isoprenylcysteine O-methyltransferase Ste14
MILAAGWLFWFVPFPINGWNRAAPERRDSRGRWGLCLQIAAYLLLFATSFWHNCPEPWCTVVALLFFALAILLSSTAVRALGRHLRFDAALSPDHQMVRMGPYRLLRHPIYTSMFCLLLGTGFLITPAPLLLLATVLFLAGTEIRIRVEDRLLASRFKDEFQDYQRSVSAYIPFVR